MNDSEKTKKSQGFVINISDSNFSNIQYQCCQPILDIQYWWTQAYPIIDQIATVTGAITGMAAVATAPIVFIDWLHNKLRQKQEVNELFWIKLILSEEEWNPSILAQELDLSEDEAKRILKGFGYTWDPKKMLYVSTDATKKLRSIRNNR